MAKTQNDTMANPPPLLTEARLQQMIDQALAEHEKTASGRGWLMLAGLMLWTVLVGLVSKFW